MESAGWNWGGRSCGECGGGRGLRGEETGTGTRSGEVAGRGKFMEGESKGGWRRSEKLQMAVRGGGYGLEQDDRWVEVERMAVRRSGGGGGGGGGLRTAVSR